MVHKEKQSLTKPVSLWPIMLASAGIVATGVISIYSLSYFQENSKSASPVSSSTLSSAPTITAVAALSAFRTPRRSNSSLSTQFSDRGKS